jgi:hypothetical protein
MLYSTKSPVVGAALIHADKQTNEHDEALLLWHSQLNLRRRPWPYGNNRMKYEHKLHLKVTIKCVSLETSPLNSWNLAHRRFAFKKFRIWILVRQPFILRIFVAYVIPSHTHVVLSQRSRRRSLLPCAILLLPYTDLTFSSWQRLTQYKLFSWASFG